MTTLPGSAGAVRIDSRADATGRDGIMSTDATRVRHHPMAVPYASKRRQARGSGCVYWTDVEIRAKVASLSRISLRARNSDR